MSGGHINIQVDNPFKGADTQKLVSAIRQGLERAEEDHERRWQQALLRRRLEIFGSEGLTRASGSE